MWVQEQGQEPRQGARLLTARCMLPLPPARPHPKATAAAPALRLLGSVRGSTRVRLSSAASRMPAWIKGDRRAARAVGEFHCAAFPRAKLPAPT